MGLPLRSRLPAPTYVGCVDPLPTITRDGVLEPPRRTALDPELLEPELLELEPLDVLDPLDPLDPLGGGADRGGGAERGGGACGMKGISRLEPPDVEDPELGGEGGGGGGASLDVVVVRGMAWAVAIAGTMSAAAMAETSSKLHVMRIGPSPDIRQCNSTATSPAAKTGQFRPKSVIVSSRAGLGGGRLTQSLHGSCDDSAGGSASGHRGHGQ